MHRPVLDYMHLCFKERRGALERFCYSQPARRNAR